MNTLPGANWLFTLQMLQSVKYYSDVTQLVQDSAKWRTWTGLDSFRLLAKESDLGFPFSAVFQHCPVQWRTHALETLDLKIVIWVQKMVIYAGDVLLWPYSFGLRVSPFRPRSRTLCRINFLWFPKFPPVSARFTRSKDASGNFVQGVCWVKDFT